MANIEQEDYSLTPEQGRARIAKYLKIPTHRIKSVDDLAATRCLILERMRMGDLEALEIAEALRAGSMPDLEWLRLSHNAIGDIGLEALMVGITGFYEEVVHYHKSKVPDHLHKMLGYNVYEGLEFLTRWGIPSVLYLLHIDLSWNSIRAPGIQSLAEAIQTGFLPHLLNLYLDCNSIGFEGTNTLCNAFYSSRLLRLEKLSMANNAVGDEGVAALSAALVAGHLPTLLELDLGRNGIGENGAAMMASVLASGHPPSQRLNLTRNRIGRRGASNFVQAFKSNCTLETEVHLDWADSSMQKRAGAYFDRNRRFNRKFQDLKFVEKSRVTTGRVLLCGNPGVGKTTLAKSLQAADEVPVPTSFSRSISFLSNPSSMFQRKQLPERIGMQVYHIETSNKDNDAREEYALSRLKLIDLVGNPDLHPLHNKFLRSSVLMQGNNTTFLVMCRAIDCDSDDTSEEEGFSKWLRLISSCAVGETKRQVLLILNRFDGAFPEQKSRFWWENGLIAELQVQFAETLEIYGLPFVIDARSRASVRQLKRKVFEQANSQLQGPYFCKGALTEPAVCALLRKKVKSWALKSSNAQKSPVVNWKTMKRKFQQRGVQPRVLRAAAEYLDEVGDIILFSESGCVFDEDCTSNQGLLMLPSEWFWGTVVTKVLLPDELPGISIKRKIEESGYITEKEVLECLQIFSATNSHAKYMHVNEILALLLRLGLCYQAGPDHGKFLFPAFIEKAGENQLMWWERVGAKPFLGHSYKLKNSRKTALPLQLFYRLQIDLANDPDLGGHADSEFQVSKTLITLKTLRMALLVGFFRNEMDPSEDHIDILARPLSESFHTAHGSAWKAQLISLLSYVFDKLQHLAVLDYPQVEFSSFTL